MRDSSKQLRRAVLLVAVLVALFVTVVTLAAPSIVARVIARELEARGLGDARFEVESLAWDRASFSDVVLDADGRLTADAVVATYSPRGLLRGEIESVRITGARWVVRTVDHSLDLGPVQTLMDARRGMPRRPRELPMERVELLDSEVVVVMDGCTWRLPTEGVLERTSSGYTVDLSASAHSRPVRVLADVERGDPSTADVFVTVDGRGDGRLAARGRLAEDGRMHVRLDASGWSTDTDMGGRRVAIVDLHARGRATLTRAPWRIDALRLEGGSDELRVGSRRLRPLTLHATTEPDGVMVELEWSAPKHRGVALVRGLPRRLVASSLRAAHVTFRVGATTTAGSKPMSIGATGEALVRRGDARLAVDVDDGRLQLRSHAPQGGQGRDLRADLRFTAAAIVRTTGDEIDAVAALSGHADAMQAFGLRGDVRRLGLHAHASRQGGEWSVDGRADAHASAIVLPRSRLRIDRASISVPLRYPFRSDDGRAIEAGDLALGPIHVRETDLPAIDGEVVQRDGELVVAASWPLTPGVSARLRGRMALDRPLRAELDITAPPFALHESEPIAAIVKRTIGGTVRGTARATGRVAIDGDEVHQSMTLRLHDAELADSPKFVHALQGVSATIDFDRIVPPISDGPQRLAWTSGQLGKLELGKGHAAVALRKGLVLDVRELAAVLGADGGGGRLEVEPFRYAPGQRDLKLRITANDLDLQRWLELLGRKEVVATGTLDGQVSLRLQLKPRFRLDLGGGALEGVEGGILQLKDERVTDALLASVTALQGASDLPIIVKERFVEALQDLRYTKLQFRLLPKGDGVTLQVHVAGRGLRGARQEIGGLTINFNHFEEVLNQVLRLRSGLEDLGHDPTAPTP